MVRDELLRLRASAAAEAATLARDLEALFAASRDSNADDEHDPEGATIGFERAQLTALLSTARERIAEVDDALRRVDTATYGVCERCGQPIAEERLVARPFARHCMACA
ncbi:TraR/DksA family transcriptional regulator [Actinoplanes aureus]|jgi:RNA polymerase-binding transcription factor DksA|uniref:TraR/DksA C4-type zinc finger protein n=1 Tax=Actinoplanes aureus TaxID=2792083 RepID=A0A931C661_9ACTN|nr:TraR/DksA C4-type zinc finger protein [Actinoplanes aureus]MBG0561352.1 TraR/DksA C4-type zinc finger protein [Actinoplanes aureus]